MNLAKTDKRFPKKGTCMAIYSRCVNAREKLDDVLGNHFPWCKEWHDELKQLFDGYVDRKEAAGVLDYDDLLLYWQALGGDEGRGAGTRPLENSPLPLGEGPGVRAARKPSYERLFARRCPHPSPLPKGEGTSANPPATPSENSSTASSSMSIKTPTRSRPKSSTAFRPRAKG